MSSAILHHDLERASAALHYHHEELTDTIRQPMSDWPSPCQQYSSIITYDVRQYQKVKDALLKGRVRAGPFAANLTL